MPYKRAGTSFGEERVQGYQLWIALPPELENAEVEAYYLSAENVAADGPARVLIGQYGNASSIIPAPAGLNYLDVQLKAGEQWNYQPPAGHTVCWLAIQKGQLRAPGEVDTGELVVFEECVEAINLEAIGETRFVLGSAVKHPHDLVLGYHSVHTTQEALVKGEAEIRRIGETLRTAGKLQ